MANNLQDRYGSVENICSNIDELLAKTTLGSSSGRKSNVNNSTRLDDLYVPLPEIVNLSGVKHSAEQPKEETDRETLQVNRAIEAVDVKLTKKREELKLQLELLGYSRDELTALCANKKVEDVVKELKLDDERIWDLDNKSTLAEIKSKKYGGALYNLKSSINEYDNLSYAGSFFSMFTGHSSTLVAQIEADKAIVRSRIKTIREFALELKNADTELLEAKTSDIQRDVLVVKAQAAFDSGSLEQARMFSAQADDLIEGIKTRLLRADERLSHKHSVDYEAQMAELRKMQKKWDSVDKSYGTTIAWMDGISRGALMAVAVGAGIVLLPVGLSAGAAFLASFAITTAVGGLLAIARNAAYAANGGEFSWKDVGSTTFEAGLMGLGGGAMAGLKTAFAGGVAATRLAVGASWGARTVNFARAAGGSGATAVGTSLPSTVYHYGEELYHAHKQLDQMIYQDDKLSKDEYDWMDRKGMIPYAREKGILNVDPKTGEIVFKPSDQDKKDLYLTMLWKRGTDLAMVYGMDMSMNFVCGVGGHTMSGFRHANLSRVMPAPAVSNGVPQVTASVTGRAMLARAGNLPLQLSTHALELLTSGASAELNLTAREKYLHEEVTAETRARAYGQALSGQLVGNIQGDIQARQQRMARNFVQDAEDIINTTAAKDIKKAGVKVEELDPVDVAKMLGPKATMQDAVFLAECIAMKQEDRYAKSYEGATGKPRKETNQRSTEALDAVLKHINEQTLYSKEFKEEFSKVLKERHEVAMDRQARISVDGPDPKARAAELEQLQTHLKRLIAEADLGSGKYFRGDGEDATGATSKLIDGWKAFAEKIKTNFVEMGSILRDIPGVAKMADVISATLGGGGKVVKGTYGLLVDNPVGMFAKTCANTVLNYGLTQYLFKPLYRLAINYSAFNSPTALHGPAGILAFWTVSLAVTKHVGFNMGRKLGLNAPRPIDAANAMASKMEIEQTVARISKLDPEFKLSPEHAKRFQKTCKNLDTVFAECSQTRRGSAFYIAGLVSLFETPMFKPALAVFGAIKAFGGVPTAAAVLGLMGHSLPWVGGFAGPVGWSALGLYCAYKGATKICNWTGTGIGIADTFTSIARGVSSENSLARIIRGETNVHGWLSVAAPALVMAGVLSNPITGLGYLSFAPILIPAWRATGGYLGNFASHICLKVADDFTPSNYKAEKSKCYTDMHLADLQTVYRRGLTDSIGLEQIKMIKALEDQLVYEFTSDKVSMQNFAQKLDTLFREVDPRIRNTILYRLSLVGDVDIDAVNAGSKEAASGFAKRKARKWKEELARMTPEEKARAIELRKAENKANRDKLKDAFGPDAGDLHAGGRKPSRTPVEAEKAALVKKLIEDRNSQKKVDEHLNPLKGDKKVSTYQVMASRARFEFSSELKQMIKEGVVDVDRVNKLLESRESYDSYGDIRKELDNRPAVEAKGSRKARNAKNGLFGEIVEQLEACREARRLALDDNDNNEVAVQDQKIANLKTLNRTLEQYVLRRERVLAILLGNEVPTSLGVKSVKNDPAARVKGMLRRRAAADRDDDGKKVQVLKIDENQERMSRKTQRETTDALIAELARADESKGVRRLTPDEQKELLSWAMNEIKAAKDDLIARKVKAEIKDPTKMSPKLSLTPVENAKRRELAAKAKHGLADDGKKIDVEKLTTELIKDPDATKIDRAPKSNKWVAAYDIIWDGIFKLNVKPLFGAIVSIPSAIAGGNLGTYRARKAAARSKALGIESKADIDTLIGKLKTDPDALGKAATYKMKELVRVMNDGSQLNQARNKAQADLKVLLGQDHKQVKSFYEGVEANRAAAEKKLTEAHAKAFSIATAVEINTLRYSEIAGLVRNHIVNNVHNWTTNKPGWIRRTFDIITFGLIVPNKLAPVKINEASVADKRSTIWDIEARTWDKNSNSWKTKEKAQDYRGFRREDRLPSSDIPSKFASLDMSLTPARPEAYGSSKLQQGALSWLTGPIDMRYSGLYGDSQLLRSATVRKTIGGVQAPFIWADRTIIPWIATRLGM